MRNLSKNFSLSPKLNQNALTCKANGPECASRDRGLSQKTPNGKEVAIGDPRPLNGSGARLGVDATGNVQGKACYTNWKIFEEKRIWFLNRPNCGVAT